MKKRTLKDETVLHTKETVIPLHETWQS